MLAACVIFIVGGVLQTVASASTGLGIMYAGRVIAGLGVGICSNLSPIYLAEISPPAIRGRLIGIYELGWQIGAVIGFWVPYGVALNIAPSMKQWRVPFGVQIIPGGVLALGTFILTESPRWLASRGHGVKALKNLAWLRNLPRDHPYVVEELAEIEAAIRRGERWPRHCGTYEDALHKQEVHVPPVPVRYAVRHAERHGHQRDQLL